MKKSKILFLAAVSATALFNACSQSEVLVDDANAVNPTQGAIEFGMAVPDNSTRASYAAGASFQIGDQIAVFGYQTTSQQEVNRIFGAESGGSLVGQAVTNDGGETWSYSPKRYWQRGSDYEFYAIFPYSLGYTFGDHDAPYFHIPTFTVDDDKDKQVDVMIAKKNQTRPFNTVEFVFNHILSNVNFYFKVSSAFDMTGINSVTMNSFDVTGLKSTGKYDQSGFTTGNAAVGAWTAQSGTYDFPEVTTGSVSSTGTHLTLAEDLLLLPQEIADDARLTVTYTLNYDGGAKTTFTKAARMASIVGTSAKSGSALLDVWNPNVRYNYILAVNPGVSNIVSEGIDWDGTNGGGDKVAGGDLVIDENGDYWVDKDGDGAGDDPVVWEDIDGDGFKEGGIDHDRDGHIDDVDQDGTTVTPGTATGDKKTEPSDGTTSGEHTGKDVILVDKDNDNIPETQLEEPGSSNGDDVVDNRYLVDYDGTLNGEQVPTTHLGKLAADDAANPYNNPSSVYYQSGNKDTFFYVDVNDNGSYDPTVDYAVVWQNIDEDAREEGIADKNRNGVADDNFDGDNVGYYVDADAVNNPGGLDVILIDMDEDGVAETQLERSGSNSEDPTVSPVIEFTATVEDWDDEYDAEVNVLD